MKNEQTAVIKDMEFLLNELHKEWERPGEVKSSVSIPYEKVEEISRKRCIFGSGLFKAMETARPISCWTSSFVIPSFSAMISKYLSTEYVFLSFIVLL